ncbi:MAG: hypothetical protein GXP55_20510 [Deltaproteobacteria bacterium]|nr:hypothetical protein [Deltaproteobacteria bacterium]
MRSRHSLALFALALSSATLLSASELPLAEATPTDDGFALSLQGRADLTLGRDLPLVGTAYVVRGLADLAPAAGAQVEAFLEERGPRGRGYQPVARASTRAARDGAYRFAIEVPERQLRGPRLRLRVSRGQAEAREYILGVSQHGNIALDLLTDRHRYEPGEALHVFVRARDADSGQVRPGLQLRLTVNAPDGDILATHVLTTSAAGVALLDVPFPDSSPDGDYSVEAILQSPVRATVGTRVQVARRTVERLLVSAEVDQGPFRPGAVVRGHVNVHTPSGSPVRDAEVTITVGEMAPLTFRTDGEGAADFRFSAPAYIAGETQWVPVAVRAAHPAHGSLQTSTRFLVSRVPFVVEARAEGSALVPEVDSRIYLAVTRPGGGAAPEGMSVSVSGDAVIGGHLRLTLDAHGLASVPARLAANDAGPSSRSGCGGFVTDLSVELGTDHPYRASVCVPVAMKAQLRPRVRRVVVAPGQDVWVDVARRASAVRAPVLLTLVGAGRPLAYATIPAGRSAGRIHVPEGAGGVVRVLARPVTSVRYAVDPQAQGRSAMGVGASDAFLVRPVDAFRTELTASQTVYRVGGTAELSLRRRPVDSSSDESAANTPAFTAVVARDLAAHGGERDFGLTWMNTAVDLAEADATSPAAQRLLRATLTTQVARDSQPRRPQPIDPDPWYSGGDGMSSSTRGTLLDPLKDRETLLRRDLGRSMMVLEQVVASLDGDAETQRGVVTERAGRRDFDPAVIQTLITSERLPRNTLNLGQRPLTLAMLQSADPSFRFDTVARRVARRRLLKLLLAVAALSDPQNDDAARVARSEPPERWLGALLRLHLLTRADLLDPWGHAFVFRRAAGRPRFPIAASAPRMEVVSPGPDGRAGTSDDVRDPFARVVTQGTLYAVVSGEDAAMRSISSLSPGPDALTAMAAAFDILGLSATEETRGDAAFASASEGMDDMMGDMAGESFGMGGLGLSGTGRGGGGMGYGTLGSRRAARSPSLRMSGASINGAPMERVSALARAGEHIRERFPATLFFVGEMPLDDDVTSIRIPLADALTTYRVETISWTASGFTTNARVEIRVQQDATIDAPVPAYASVGDELRIPIRVQNHTEDPLEVRVELSAEGLDATAGAPLRLTIPPRDALAREVVVRLNAAGEGALVARVVKASDGSPLDAVRRPLVVYPEARLVREERRLLFRSDTSVTFEVPEDASERGPAQLSLTVGEEIFGDLFAMPGVGPGWVLAALGRDMPAEFAQRGTAALMTRWRTRGESMSMGPDDAALAVAVAHFDPLADDDMLRAALAAVSATLERHPEESGEASRARLDRRSSILLLLAPALSAEAHAAVREDLQRLVRRLGRLVRERALGLTDRPSSVARAAAALAMVGDVEAAEELARRADREQVQFGDRAFLEPAEAVGVPSARVEPTALLAIVHAKLGDQAGAMRLLRSLLADPALVTGRSRDTRLLAALAAGLLGPPPRGVLTLEVDGNELPMSHENGVYTVTIEGLGRPGEHRIGLSTGHGSLALGRLELRYGRLWSAAPTRPARLGLDVDGQVGARDTRSGLRLTVRNTNPRLMARPIVELDLPAGVELDEPTRARLGRITRVPPSVEGRTLKLELRPLPPQSRMRIPLPLRFTVGGALRGLGVVAYDGGARSLDGARPMSLLAPRTLEVADTGPPPEEVEDEVPVAPPVHPPPALDVLRRSPEARR